MWIPRSEEDLVKASVTRSLEETVTFDAKKEVPTKSIETAKDVSALANTAGGVLLYGVDEDDSGCPCLLNPIPLANQRERIDQIVRTSVDEVPTYTISAISSQADSTKGYLVVLVPPSERAPHMVIAKGERRFYGRGETGNYILSQAEVARLYERRQQVTTSNVEPFLQGFLDDPPIPRSGNFAHLYIVAKPVLRDDDILIKARKSGESSEDMLSTLIEEVRMNDVYDIQSYSPDFMRPPKGWKRHPEGFVGKMVYASENDPRPDAHTLQIRVNLDGSASLFCGRASDTTAGEKYFISSIVEGNTVRFLALLGRLFDRASYFSLVDIGLVITDLLNCVPFETRSRFYDPPRYDGPDYRKTVRVSALKLLDCPRDIASQLLTPVFEAVSQNTLRPFQISA